MRKLATAAAVSLALASGGAFGLGLGDIEMRSALNQPMDAEIRLTSVQAGELDGMIVKLASPAAFARAGIERSTALTNLRFTVDQSSGSPVIRITSQQPVVEPFLNFLLEIDWPQGRMVREYTVLLDPPVFMTPTATERNTSADQPAVVQRGNEALVVPTPIERDSGEEVDLAGLTEEATAAVSDNADEGEIVSLELLPDDALLGGASDINPDAGEIVSLTDLSAPNSAALEEREQFLAEQQARLDAITVELADSVEEVSDTTVVAGEPEPELAADVDGSTIVSLDELLPEVETPTVTASADSGSTAGRQVTVGQGDTLYEIAKDNAGGVSVQQMMMALLAANESAFINQNINLVRAGSILRVPDSEEASSLTQAQALAAIGQQNQLWQEYRDTLSGGNTRIASGTRSDSEAATTPSSDTTAIDTAALDPELSSDDALDGLSPEARAILDNARNEILERDELRIVADSAPTSTTASATADETTDNDASRLGEVNLKLQLAREELASTRLQADELADQANELQGTTENLDALVTLRQNEIAQLESQLAEARKASEEAAGIAASAAENTLADAGDAAESAADSVAGAVNEATDAAAAAVDNATDTVAGVADDVAADAEEVANAAADTVADAGNAAEEVADSGVNALTEAGEELAQVELLGDEEATGASEADESEAVVPPPRIQSSWYQDFINDPKRMMIAGIGGIGLLGVAGTLLFRRRRRDEQLLDFDEAEFNDEELAQSGKGVNLSGAGLAAGAAAGAAAFTGARDVDPAAPTAEELADASLESSAGKQAVAASTDTIDQDDTISEVDVYLAYGLHGQAEELLSRATERDPGNQEYANKLLQTYHAQGNADGFHEAARNFHARFGGEANPEWAAIAAMGAELRPGDELYAAANGSVERIGSGHSDGLALGDDDFLPAHETDEGSVSRDFGSSAQALDFSSEDESSLLEQSIDPAFAFDEDDLEATGDFSGIADELAAEEGDGSIDFPGFGDADKAAQEIESDLTDAAGQAENLASERVADAAGGLSGDLSGDLTNELSADLTSGDELLGDALTMDELDRVASVDDLTLDLDQLSGDLDLDSSELLNSDLTDLELPDLTADDDLMLDNAGNTDNTDEMDTMLDLAKAYIDMGDKDSASSALDEIVKSGNPEQVTEAETLLRKIS
ncbi:FimV/HubP family polar landmark protein [Granulosicoccus sp. 3-233]|uniref:FimV/HubP family polar landmark protein n=1 Tax=Granulosicoccus sp. 3-233 TaxID=3417969 RepID=UPI003D3469B4